MRKLWIVVFVLLQILIAWGIYDSVRFAEFDSINWSTLFRGNWEDISFTNIKHKEPLVTNFMGARNVRIEGFVGDMDIVYGDVSEITFDGQKTLSHSSVDMDAFNNSYIEERRQGDILTLVWRKPQGYRGTVGFTGQVTIPRSVESLDVEVTLGKVSSTGGTNNLNISADLGDVRVDDHTGSVVIDADLGAVRLSNIKATDVLKITADLGEINYRGSLALNSVIRASLGSIKLTLPEDTLTNIDASVDLGSLDCDFPLTTYSKRSLGSDVIGIMGDQSLGVPSGNLTIKADLGSIDIKRAVIW
ncbi:MAG: DUF4097 family beta strand repeat-containing protein [Firmicutes bacterium]|nr:DUF4097 family beta strand repeat-containing protein [Bacillota bacterium]